MLRAAARIQSNLLCKFINSGSMYLGIYTREEKMCPQDAVFLRDSLESVVSSERLFGKRSFSTASAAKRIPFSGFCDVERPRIVPVLHRHTRITAAEYVEMWVSGCSWVSISLGNTMVLFLSDNSLSRKLSVDKYVLSAALRSFNLSTDAFSVPSHRSLHSG